MIAEFLSAVVVLGTVAEVSAEELKKDKDRLQGRWQFVAIEDASGASDQAKRNLDKIFWIFKGDITYWEAGSDGTNAEMQFRLHYLSGRRSIDLTAVGTDFKKLGIFQLDGDNLKICVCRNADKPRPTDFTSKPGSDNLIVSLRRVKD